MDKHKYLTTEFWAAIVTSILTLLVTFGAITSDEAAEWNVMLVGFVASVLPVVALIIGYSRQRANNLRLGIVATDLPGHLTVEFWMTLATTVVMILSATQIINQESGMKFLDLIGPVIASVLTIVTYILSRSVVKESRAVALYTRGVGSPPV